MSGMPQYARSAGWNRLRRFLIAGAIALSPVFFAVMYLSVTALVRPSFHGWAWTVPVGTEGCFVLLYGLDLLLEWAGKPMGWLRLVPYPFAAASLWLNVYSSRGDLPGMVGHGVVTVAFFTPLIAGEAAVRRLAVTDEQARIAVAMADARRHAIDLCRDRRGVLWRFRVPSLLRRQVLSGRLPGDVRSDVARDAGAGRSGGWEPAVRGWVFRELNIGVIAEAASAKAVRDIAAAIVPAAVPPGLPAAAETGAPPAAEPVSGRTAGRTPGASPKPRAKLTARRSRGMAPDALVPWVSGLLDDDPAVSLNRVTAELHVGREKASEALRLARKARMSAAAGASR